jgi:catechol 2,3-dioxygenase-like lactoylglutathione lyase family enzyme
MTVDVRYLVDDVETSAGFYVDRLGFSEEGDWEGAPFRMVRRGELRLWISGPGSSASSSAARSSPGRAASRPS